MGWNDDVARYVVVAILLGLIPFYYWRRARFRRRNRSMNAELNEIARLAQSGEYAEAERRCLALQDRCTQPDRPADRAAIFRSSMQLAAARVAVGRLAEAEADLAEVVRELGPDHRPDLASAWQVTAFLAWVVVQRGRYAEGISIAERVVRECAKRWGDTAAVTMGAKHTLITCLTEGDRPEQALPLASARLEYALSTHDEQSGFVTSARHCLAEAQLKLGLLDEAEAGLHASLAGYEAQLADRIAGTGVRFALAKIAALRGQVGEAREGFYVVLNVLQDATGPAGPWALLTRFELAELDARAGDLDSALAMHRSVLADRERVLGPEHPLTVASRLAVEKCAS